jgi:hypothetical protein
MRNCPETMLVARHGIALTFDLMREPEIKESLQVDVWKVRKQALDAGMHDVLVKVMNEVSGAAHTGLSMQLCLTEPLLLSSRSQHSGTMDIMMMGSEILAGTDYNGALPQYNPANTSENDELSETTMTASANALCSRRA